MKYIGYLFFSLYRIGLQLFVLGLIFFVITLALFYTNPGAKLSIGLMKLFVPYPVQVKEIEGCLAGPLTLKKVSIQHPGFHFTADYITADWSANAFKNIKKSINLKQLKAHNVKIIYPDTHENWFGEIPSLSSIAHQIQELLAVKLIIEDFHTTQLAVQLSDTPITIHALSFSRGASHENHLFKTLQIKAEYGSLLFEQHDPYIHLKWDFKVPQLSHYVPHLEGDLSTQGLLKVHDINQIDNDSTAQFHIQAKKLVYLDKKISDLALNGVGTFDKHTLELRGFFNDHKVNSTLIGHLNKKQYKEKLDWQLELKNLDIKHKQWGIIPTSTGKISLQLDKLQEKLHSYIHINVLGKNNLNANLQIDTQARDPHTPNVPHSTLSYPLSGQIQGQIADFEFLEKWFPELEDIHGQAALNLNMQGSLLNPVIGGQVSLTNITIDAAQLNNLSTNLHISLLNLESSGDGILKIAGKGTMGKGHFTIEGSSDFTQASPVVDLSLKGSMLTLSQTPEYFIIADANLRLQLKNNIPQLTGTLFIPRADIETQTFNKDTVQPSSDIVILDSSKQEPSQKLVSEKFTRPGPLHKQYNQYAPLVTNLQITLGDHIHYKGFGLQTHVVGSLNIFTQNSNLHARGKLNFVNGKYRTHGNLLDIQQGQIAFLGDQLSNPTWDIRAVKQIYAPIQNKLFSSFKKPRDTVWFESSNNVMTAHKPILVGLSLKGSVQNPILKMFSVPTMKEADIISYLVLNKPQREASEAQTTLVLEAANELIHFLGNQRREVKLDLAKSLKLDRFGLNQIETNIPGQNDLKQTAFVIGKQLSNRLYAEYSLRVLDTASALSLRYLLSKHVTLQASASKESASGDIVFTFESG